MNRVNLVILTSIFLIALFTFISILIARGYLPDLRTRSLLPTGILVSTSDPDGARVYIDNKLTTATNNTINLSPGNYQIRIEKDGFTSWEKSIDIKKEEVIKTNAFLFPQFPDLGPLTLTSVLNPEASPDERRIVYGVASSSAERNGVWILDMDAGRPIIGGVNLRQVYHDPDGIIPSNNPSLAGYNFLWSPDGLQVLVYTKTNPDVAIATSSANPYSQFKNSVQINRAYILETNQLNTLPQNIDKPGLDLLLRSWSGLWQDRNELALSKLGSPLGQFIHTNTSNFSLSLDENKVLYTASVAASLPKIRNGYLPGTNPTPETREIKAGSTYVYDIKEDRNYLIDKCSNKSTSCLWFPSSRHLLSFTDKEISVMEFDGTNKSVLYTGPFVKDFIVAWPNWSKIVILTSLNSLSGGENLYTINLR